MADPTALDTPVKEKKEKVKWGSRRWWIERVRPLLKKNFGTDDVDHAIDLLSRTCSKSSLTDVEVLDLAEMLVYWMDHKKDPWTTGADLFRHYLGIGAPSAPVRFLPSSLLTDSADFRNELCSKHYPIIEKAIRARVADTTGSLFPKNSNGKAVTQTLPDSRGNIITVQPQPSPLRNGGGEVIYYEFWVAVSKTEAAELAATLGGVGVISQVEVDSQVIQPGEWRITITNWTCWAWDDGDFNQKQVNTQVFPIDVVDMLPDWMGRDKILDSVSDLFGISRSCIESPMAYDEYMRQLDGRTISKTSLTSGQPVTYYPRAFKIYFDAWDFYAFPANCPRPQEFTINE